MSPTLLEAAIVIVLIVLGWQIGIQLGPVVWRYWQAARQQLDQIDQLPPVGPNLPSRKEASDERANGSESEESPDRS